MMIWNAKNKTVSIHQTDMNYVSFGSGKKNFIILPGLSDGLATVKGKALLLAKPCTQFFKDYTVYMFSRMNDLPEGYSIKDMAKDQILVLQTLGIQKISILGVSEGGMIAQYIAIEAPDMVEKLVLAVTAPNVNETIQDCLNTWMKATQKEDHQTLMMDTAMRSYSDTYLNKYKLFFPLLSLVGKPKDQYHRFLVNASAIQNFDARNELNKIACPVLIIGGEEDLIVGKDASIELHKLIPNSELYLYPKLGHALYEEAPDFNQRVFDFLESEHI